MANLKKIINKVQEHLSEGEEVVAAIRGKYEKEHHGENRMSIRSGGLIATDQRLIFYAPKWFSHEMEIFPYTNISSIENGSRMIRGDYVHIFTSGNKLKMKRVRGGDTDKFVSYVRDRINSVRSESGKSSGVVSPTDRLEKLAELHDKGVVSDEEFEVKKAELLEQI